MKKTCINLFTLLMMAVTVGCGDTDEENLVRCYRNTSEDPCGLWVGWEKDIDKPVTHTASEIVDRYECKEMVRGWFGDGIAGRMDSLNGFPVMVDLCDEHQYRGEPLYP